MSFDAKQYLIKLGNKDYLPVAARLLWLNEAEKNFTIETDIVKLEDTYATCQATVTIYNAEGGLIRSAKSYKREDKNSFADFLEKACTGAVGRALGMLGFGTQFTDDFDEINTKSGARVVDAPQTPVNSNLFSEAQHKRLGAIASKLFPDLKGKELTARVTEAANKILGVEGVSLAALNKADGQKVMKALEDQAVKNGVWEAKAA